MGIKELHSRLLSDIELLGLPTDYTLDIRGFSKTYWGRYDPNKELVILYPEKEEGDLYKYSKVLKEVIHESIHHYQWKHDNDFQRKFGVMHNKEFKELYKKYINKAKDLGIIEEVENETVH